jgi:Protein of unknown function (DUF1236)
MKRVLLAGVAVLALSGPAFAQSGTMTTTAPGASATVTIAPEQRTKIKQFVVEKNVKPVTVKEKIVVGATLPADVELQAVPADWGPDLVKYRYINWDNHVVFVEPSSRKVVTVID